VLVFWVAVFIVTLVSTLAEYLCMPKYKTLVKIDNEESSAINSCENSKISNPLEKPALNSLWKSQAKEPFSKKIKKKLSLPLEKDHKYTNPLFKDQDGVSVKTLFSLRRTFEKMTSRHSDLAFIDGIKVISFLWVSIEMGLMSSFEGPLLNFYKIMEYMTN